jgi:hypothetical protein
LGEEASLRGSRYDNPVRDTLPVFEYRQRKTLSVFLAAALGFAARRNGGSETGYSQHAWDT